MTRILPPVDLVPAPSRRHRPRLALGLAVAVLVLIIAAVGTAIAVDRHRTSDARQTYLSTSGWPAQGQAAYEYGGRIWASPHQQAVPIASLAKVMTAYVVLHDHPLARTADRPALRVTAADVADTARRRADGQSVVSLRVGERLSERQALAALLLPSANNLAIMLARWSAGSEPAFVDRMNATARHLQLSSTRYTDPSGYRANTVSTAWDQTRLARAIAGNETFAELVSAPSLRLPTGVVHNTDTLLGQDAFVGTKTGSDDAAQGCFMFRTYRVINRQATDVVGVVLGQRGHNLILAALTATRQLADRLGAPAQA